MAHSSNKEDPGKGNKQINELLAQTVPDNDWGDGRSTDSDNAQWINIRSILKVIPRDNPNDPFKVNSADAISRLAQGQSLGQRKTKALGKVEEEMLQNFGADIDMCTPLDRTNPPGADTTNISRESRLELQKLPSWMRSFIESKFDTIHDKYKHHTHVFLQMLASRVEYRKMKYWSLLSKNIERNTEPPKQLDERDEETENLMNNYEIQAPQKRMDKIPISLDPFRSPDLFEIDEKSSEPDVWSPILLQRAADALRAMMLAAASESEGEMDDEAEGAAASSSVAAERAKRKGIVRKEEEYTYKGPHWEDLVAERDFFREKAKFEVELEFTPKDKKRGFFMKSCIPKIPKSEKKDEKKIRRNKEQVEDDIENQIAEKKHREALEEEKLLEGEEDAGDGSDNGIKSCFGEKSDKSKYYSYNPGHPLYRKPKSKVRRKARLFQERGVGKRPSRIYVKDQCKGPITQVARELHQPRPMEGFHAYVNYIVESNWFKNFILCAILINAVLLAAEISEKEAKYSHLFDILDSIFLSIYVVEFSIKIYANPIQYFSSGFNVFDFIILIVSLIKATLEYTHYGDVVWLRFFIIIRALRVLRGVSLSIHIQVLVTALVETLKNHVLSVVVLLLILMYIASIVAFLFFAKNDTLNKSWGFVPTGMLRLFSFVTMDGWTDVLEEFIDADQIPQGRLFCLISIVLGNFLFYNIFIAIIIMQISEATDSFRKSQFEQKESSVFLKQEAVFRRQKLDMRQLLARQKMGVAEDFYELGSKFVRRLRHDDLCENRHVIFSPLWMDAYYKTMKRTHHTSNILMNIHRKMSDRLVALNNFYNEGKYKTRGISRARYNRYVETKAKLRVLKEVFVDLNNPSKLNEKHTLKVKLPEKELKVTIKPHATKINHN